jgi:hypothetical protein
VLLTLEKANAIDDCSEDQFTPQNLRDEHNERQVEAGIQALLEDENNPPAHSEIVRPFDVQNLMNSIK